MEVLAIGLMGLGVLGLLGVLGASTGLITEIELDKLFFASCSKTGTAKISVKIGHNPVYSLSYR